MRFVDESRDALAQLQRQRCVQRDERLIEKQERGADGERAGERGAARKPQRQPSRKLVAMRGEVKVGKQPVDLFGARLRRGDLEIVEDAAPGKEPRLLKGHAEPASPGQIDLARKIRVQAGDDAQKRRLAASRRTDERAGLAARHRKAQIGDDLGPASVRAQKFF